MWTPPDLSSWSPRTPSSCFFSQPSGPTPGCLPWVPVVISGGMGGGGKGKLDGDEGQCLEGLRRRQDRAG